MMARVLSGIQPSGILTLGNYIGALQNFVKLQDEDECYFMIVDLHAITVPQKPEMLHEQSESVAALFIASGIDPDRAAVFLQSHVSAHAQMGWLMTTLSYMGELERMTQYKEKSAGQQSIGAGLFVYPALMAADILLYQADKVPVGDDQKQHLELTRDLAERFNGRYGPYLKMPEPFIPEVGARIMSLDDASNKMSKSNPNPNSYISMLDEPDVIRKKIRRATTDSDAQVRFDKEKKPEISNLMSIYAHCSGMSLDEIEREYDGKGYGDFKKDLAEHVVATLQPIQDKYKEIRASGELTRYLREGAEKAEAVAEETLTEVKRRMGFVLQSRS